MTRAGAATDAAPASSDRGLCAHEATHATAAWLLGRELGEVIVDGDRSHADVATLRADVGPGDVGLEVVVDDLVVLLSANTLARRSIPRPRPSERDERDARDLAARFTANPDEAHALVELGRAKARSVVSSQFFIDLVGVLADHIGERGELGGEEIQRILNGGNGNGKTE
jgi:hypothetical protein